MNLPPGVHEYLNARLVDSRLPFCMHINDDGRLIDYWGAAEHYGLAGIGSGDDISAEVPFIDALANGSPVELPFITDTRGHHFHAHLLPSIQGCYVVYVDADAEHAERQQAQQTANEVKLLLEREQRFTAELIDARTELTLRRKQAEEQNKKRGEYIAVVSHELRTPLTALLAHIEQLRQVTDIADSKETAGILQRIAQQQLWLVNNLLTNARLDADGFSIHRHVSDVRALATDLSNVFGPLAADRGLSFAIFVSGNVPDFITFDELHVQQVLVNLLSNAIKYTEEGSVGLELDYLDETLLATVSDTGPGISVEDQRRLFVPYQRGSNAPRVVGAGLGLSITHALVEAMDGVLDFQSTRRKGTCVSLKFPAPEARGEAGAVADCPAHQSILIGEDDPDLADLMALKLTEAGYSVELAEDGKSVVQRALDSRPDLIILDSNMPVLDGPSAARALREKGYLAPILALSAASRREDIEHALASGCTEFLRKPVRPEALRHVVKRLVLGSRNSA